MLFLLGFFICLSLGLSVGLYLLYKQGLKDRVQLAAALKTITLDHLNLVKVVEEQAETIDELKSQCSQLSFKVVNRG